MSHITILEMTLCQIRSMVMIYIVSEGITYIGITIMIHSTSRSTNHINIVVMTKIMIT